MTGNNWINLCISAVVNLVTFWKGWGSVTRENLVTCGDSNRFDQVAAYHWKVTGDNWINLCISAMVNCRVSKVTIETIGQLFVLIQV